MQNEIVEQVRKAPEEQAAKFRRQSFLRKVGIDPFQFEADVASGRITLLPMDRAIEERFHQLALRLHRLTPPIFTRTLDAIHLATADFNQAAELVATDGNLRNCADAIALKVFP